MKQDLGKFIKIKRIEIDLSLKDFAKEMGVSTSFLSQIENGKKSFPARGKVPNFLDKMATVLHLNEADYKIFKELVDSNLIAKKKIHWDITDYLLSTPKAYEALCLAIKYNIGNDGWIKFIEDITNKI